MKSVGRSKLQVTLTLLVCGSLIGLPVEAGARTLVGRPGANPRPVPPGSDPGSQVPVPPDRTPDREPQGRPSTEPDDRDEPNDDPADRGRGGRRDDDSDDDDDRDDADRDDRDDRDDDDRDRDRDGDRKKKKKSSMWPGILIGAGAGVLGTMLVSSWLGRRDEEQARQAMQRGNGLPPYSNDPRMQEFCMMHPGSCMQTPSGASAPPRGPSGGGGGGGGSTPYQGNPAGATQPATTQPGAPQSGSSAPAPATNPAAPASDAAAPGEIPATEGPTAGKSPQEVAAANTNDTATDEAARAGDSLQTMASGYNDADAGMCMPGIQPPASDFMEFLARNPIEPQDPIAEADDALLAFNELSGDGSGMTPSDGMSSDQDQSMAPEGWEPPALEEEFVGPPEPFVGPPEPVQGIAPFQ